MKALVIGGGKVGSFLALKLAHDGHVVRVIESRYEIAQKLEDKVSDEDLRGNCLVLVGDGTDVKLLKDADIARSDWVLAVSGRDDVNLVAAQLADTFGVDRVLARLNDPANRDTFKALGIKAVAVTDLMAKALELDLKADVLDRAAVLAHGQLVVSEINVGPGFETRPLRDIEVSADSVIVAVERDDDVHIARGDTIIGPGDRVVAASLIETADKLPGTFCAERSRK
jgi:trk system potassium uptake protein TrkA